MKNNREIAVFGCEHSGTRVITQNLLLHPHVNNDEVEHHSLPSGPMGWNPMSQLIERCQSPNYDIRIVFVMRDQTAIRHSHRRRGKNSFEVLLQKHIENKRPQHGGWACFSTDVADNWAESFRRVAEACEQTGTKYSIVSYEAYNQCRVPIITKMFRDIDIDPTAMDWSKEMPEMFSKRFGWDAGNIYVKPHDGNRKYFKGEK